MSLASPTTAANRTERRARRAAESRARMAARHIPTFKQRQAHPSTDKQEKA